VLYHQRDNRKNQKCIWALTFYALNRTTNEVPPCLLLSLVS
jgi:hypothetical protein